MTPSRDQDSAAESADALPVQTERGFKPAELRLIATLTKQITRRCTIERTDTRENVTRRADD